MILRIETLKDACKDILTAVDNNQLSEITETLELETYNSNLYMRVTNREYIVSLKIPVSDEVDFHATVNANLFLKLISQTTTDTVELEVKDTYLMVKANGTYKLPLIFDGDKLLQLPDIEINNVTNEFNIKGEVLRSILDYNSKELTRGTVSKTVQNFYYIDEKGAITFRDSACVNSFILEQPVKLLFNNRLVKLFKLFNEENISFTLGYDAISNDIIQTKVRFATSNIVITAILSCDDTLLNSVPVAAIRGRVTSMYPYNVNISKQSLLETLNRLSLFLTGSDDKSVIKPYCSFEFYQDYVIIYDKDKNNNEKVYYNNTQVNLDTPYEAILDIKEIKSIIENCNDEFVNINFGDNTAFVITKGHISNVVAECH